MPARVSKFALTAVLIGLAAALPNYVKRDGNAYGDNYYPTGTDVYAAPTDYRANIPPPDYTGTPITYTDYKTHTNTYTLTHSVPCGPYTYEGVVYTMTATTTEVESCETEAVVLTRGCDEHGCYGAPEPTSTGYDLEEYDAKDYNPNNADWEYDDADKHWHYHPVGSSYDLKQYDAKDSNPNDADWQYDDADKHWHYHPMGKPAYGAGHGDDQCAEKTVYVTVTKTVPGYTGPTDVTGSTGSGYGAGYVAPADTDMSGHGHGSGSGYVVSSDNDNSGYDHDHGHGSGSGYVVSSDNDNSGYDHDHDHGSGSGYVVSSDNDNSGYDHDHDHGYGAGYVVPADNDNSHDHPDDKDCDTDNDKDHDHEGYETEGDHDHDHDHDHDYEHEHDSEHVYDNDQGHDSYGTTEQPESYKGTATYTTPGPNSYDSTSVPPPPSYDSGDKSTDVPCPTETPVDSYTAPPAKTY